MTEVFSWRRDCADMQEGRSDAWGISIRFTNSKAVRSVDRCSGSRDDYRKLTTCFCCYSALSSEIDDLWLSKRLSSSDIGSWSYERKTKQRNFLDVDKPDIVALWKIIPARRPKFLLQKTCLNTNWVTSAAPSSFLAAEQLVAFLVSFFVDCSNAKAHTHTHTHTHEHNIQKSQCLLNSNSTFLYSCEGVLEYTWYQAAVYRARGTNACPQGVRFQNGGHRFLQPSPLPRSL